MVSKKFIENFSKMNFKDDEIVVVLLTDDMKVLAEVPLQDLEITNTKNLFKMTASPTIFRDVKTNGYFGAHIVNRTIDNTTITSTSLQQPPVNRVNDIEIHWNNGTGIVQLKKV